MTNGTTFITNTDDDGIIKSIGESNDIFRVFETGGQGANNTVPASP